MKLIFMENNRFHDRSLLQSTPIQQWIVTLTTENICPKLSVMPNVSSRESLPLAIHCTAARDAHCYATAERPSYRLKCVQPRTHSGGLPTSGPLVSGMCPIRKDTWKTNNMSYETYSMHGKVKNTWALEKVSEKPRESDGCWWSFFKNRYEHDWVAWNDVAA